MNWSPDTWLALAALVLSIVGPATVWFLKSISKDEIDDAISEVRGENDKAMAAFALAHDRLKQQVIDHDRAIIRLEDNQRVLPTKEDVHRLELSIEKLSGNVSTLSSEVQHGSRLSTANGAKLDRLEQQFHQREGT